MQTKQLPAILFIHWGLLAGGSLTPNRHTHGICPETPKQNQNTNLGESVEARG